MGATAHRTDLLFAVADDEEFADLMEKFNLHDSGEDVNVGCKGKDGLHYPMPEDELDEDVLTEFIEDFIAGKAKPFIKSKPIPTYNQLAEAYADNDKVVIAKMDATSNDIPRADLFAVQGFPTIFFKAAGSEEVKTYDSGRDFDSFKSYIDENAVNVESIKDEL